MSVDILGTSWDQCRSIIQYSFTSTETRRLVRTDSPGQPSRLSHSSWTMFCCCCCCCWLLLYSAILRSWADSLHSCRMWFYMSDTGVSHIHCTANTSVWTKRLTDSQTQEGCTGGPKRKKEKKRHTKHSPRCSLPDGNLHVHQGAGGWRHVLRSRETVAQPHRLLWHHRQPGVWQSRRCVWTLVSLLYCMCASEFDLMLCSAMEDVICDFLWGFRLNCSFLSVWCYVLWWWWWWSLLYNSDILCFWVDCLHFCDVWF